MIMVIIIIKPLDSKNHFQIPPAPAPARGMAEFILRLFEFGLVQFILYSYYMCLVRGGGG